MDRVVARAGRFRHVVFPGSVGGYGRALNLAPAAPAQYASSPYAAPHCVVDASPHSDSLSADAESFLCGLFAHVGIGMRHYKPETLCRRLPACLRALRAGNLAHARSVLRRNPHLAWDALAALVIGVTTFFRDPAVFDALRDDVLPALAAECRGRPLRVWSVGCSEGAELYSVAMLLAEVGATADIGCELLGTDCRPAALARAAAGAFEPSAVAGVPPALLARYFTFDRAHFQVDESIRCATSWQAADALRPENAPPGEWDLVLCRNLAIYLQPTATANLWATLARSVRTGGVLVTGKAERPLGVRGLSSIGPCLYRKGRPSP